MTNLLNKAKQIKLVIFDVDGVLTDGSLYFSEQGMAFKAFQVHDGVGIKLLLENKIEVAVITQHDSPIVTHRMETLGIQYIYVGETPKLTSYENLLKKINLKDEQVAYVGDDFPDLPVLRRAGLSIIVANASPQLLPYVDWQTQKSGGQGAAREVCDLILQAQNLMPKIIEKYT